jgi:hypothetical protein
VGPEPQSAVGGRDPHPQPAPQRADRASRDEPFSYRFLSSSAHRAGHAAFAFAQRAHIPESSSIALEAAVLPSPDWRCSTRVQTWTPHLPGGRARRPAGSTGTTNNPKTTRAGPGLAIGSPRGAGAVHLAVQLGNAARKRGCSTWVDFFTATSSRVLQTKDKSARHRGLPGRRLHSTSNSRYAGSPVAASSPRDPSSFDGCRRDRQR